MVICLEMMVGTTMKDMIAEVHKRNESSNKMIAYSNRSDGVLTEVTAVTAKMPL